MDSEELTAQQPGTTALGRQDRAKSFLKDGLLLGFAEVGEALFADECFQTGECVGRGWRQMQAQQMRATIVPAACRSPHQLLPDESGHAMNGSPIRKRLLIWQIALP
ncbi:hypothetical protein FQZ97_1239620 [compost metagenome]